MKKRTGLKFDEDKDFSRFCVLLTETEIRFSLGGSKIVVLDEKDLKDLQGPAKDLALRATPVVIRRDGKRGALPTSAEAEELLTRFAKAH